MACLSVVSLVFAAALPAGFRPVDFVASTGAQYVDTGYRPAADDAVECVIEVPQAQGHSFPAVFGARRTSWRDNAFAFFTRFGGRDEPVYNRSGDERHGRDFPYGRKVTLRCRGNEATWDGGRLTAEGRLEDCANSLFIFNVNTGGTGCAEPDSNGGLAMRLHSFRIAAADGTSRRDFIPCANAKGEIGLWDSVTRRFFGNAGRGRFRSETATDYSRDAEFVRAFRDGALAIAKLKMAQVEVGRTKPGNRTVVPLGPRIATGGGYGGFFLWDSVFCIMWARHVPGDAFPIHSTLDNFYAVQQDDGFICREYDAKGNPCWSSSHPIALNPPILSWAEAILFREGRSDRARLRKVYPHLVRFHNCVRGKFRRPDGLYFGDALGCGMDDLPRFPYGCTDERKRTGGIAISPAALGPMTGGWWDGWLKGCQAFYSWNRQAGWIDISSQMALDCLNLAEIAEALGKAKEAEDWRKEHRELAAVINAKCWDEERGYYFDCTDEGIIPRYHAGGMWAMLARVPSRAQAEKMLKTACDPRVFNRPCGFPALGANDPEYDSEGGFWKGSVWPPTTYVAIRALMEYGFRDAATDLARRWYNANAALWEVTETVWENISAEQCDGPKKCAGSDFCGWGALAPVAIPAEFGFGISRKGATR